MKIKEWPVHIAQGVLLGVGNIIPGVSGGTIALILGIYQRVLQALANINGQTVKSLLIFNKQKEEKPVQRFVAEMRRIDAPFLGLLATGAFIAIICFSFLLSRDGYLMKHHRAATYNFFFGIVLISIIFPYRLIGRKSWREGIMALIAIALLAGFAAYNAKEISSGNIALLDRSSAATIMFGLFIYFISGAAAISAMVLPGISGSLMLLLIGGYFEILYSIKTVVYSLKYLLGFSRQAVSGTADAYLVLTVFAFGCLLGLLAFTRLISYVLKKYYDLTMAFLTGLVAGSLYGIWPFRQGNKNVLPDFSSSEAWYSCISFLVGVFLVAGFYFYEKKNIVDGEKNDAG